MVGMEAVAAEWSPPVVCANRIEPDLAPSDCDTVPLRRDGAWAPWAKIGASASHEDTLPPMWAGRAWAGPPRSLLVGSGLTNTIRSSYWARRSHPEGAIR